MLNRWEQSIVDRLRHGLHNRHAVTLCADEVHLPMNAIIERDELRQRSAWVPVAERLPETACRVLAWDGGLLWDSHFDGEFFHMGNLNGCIRVTHWMPLPEPPAGEGAGNE